MQVAVQQQGLPSPREADTRVDRALRATSMRLEAIALLPADASPDVALAEEAHARLFPEGLRSLKQSDDPARLALARKALAPIDALRAAQVAGRKEGASGDAAPVDVVADGEEGVTPETPVPAVDDDAAGGA